MIGSIGTVILVNVYYVKRTGHEMYDKIVTITGVILDLTNN